MPRPSPARIDSRGKPGMGGGVGAVAPVTVYMLVVVTPLVVRVVEVTVWLAVAVTVDNTVVGTVVVPPVAVVT